MKRSWSRTEPGDKWYLDDVVTKMNREVFYLWRAVDQHGDVLDILLQKQRNKEASHKSTRRRERAMQRFKSRPRAQSFCSAHDQINTLLRPHRHRLSKYSCRHARNEAFDLWNDFTDELVAA